MKSISFEKNWPFDIVKNQLITELPYIGNQYDISFDLLISKYDTAVYQTIIHFGLGGDSAYGDRAPAVWVHKDKYLHVTSSINDNLNHFYNVQSMPIVENKWFSVKISQTLVDGKYIYEVFVNGDQVYTVENTKAQKFAPVKVFAGDNFWNAPEGKIRNLKIYTRHE
eukprot:TRINITY_DN474_c0_g1_i18.p1 TRINITY_DN474_c0_g1~~TRINITY_DN474_c0_g1_i18.p1  ORF type:complete len:187 (-),score=26.30 TRINITY_DN474_c0_g1_i18:82-582(-)